jgi:hypothetical protein
MVMPISGNKLRVTRYVKLWPKSYTIVDNRYIIHTFSVVVWNMWFSEVGRQKKPHKMYDL